MARSDRSGGSLRHTLIEEHEDLWDVRQLLWTEENLEWSISARIDLARRAPRVVLSSSWSRSDPPKVFPAGRARVGEDIEGVSP
jgi:hypothetical protein